MLELSKQKLLIIAPHPDDEVIGCGGMIKKIKEAGGRVYVLFLTVGDTRDFTKKGLSTAKERGTEIKKVAKYLKYDDYELVFAGNDFHLKLDLLGQKKLMDVIERESRVSLEAVSPTVVAFPSPISYNQDHRTTALAAHAALRPAAQNRKHFVKTVLSYESPADIWNTKNEFEPNFFVPLSRSELQAKIRALKLYKCQLRDLPNLRSPKTLFDLAAIRGALFGCELAEAYKIWRVGL